MKYFSNHYFRQKKIMPKIRNYKKVKTRFKQLWILNNVIISCTIIKGEIKNKVLILIKKDLFSMKVILQL